MISKVDANTFLLGGEERNASKKRYMASENEREIRIGGDIVHNRCKQTVNLCPPARLCISGMYNQNKMTFESFY